MTGLAEDLADLWADVRAHPRLALLEYGSLAVSILLFVGTVVALAGGPPVGRGDRWLAVLVVGTAFALFWTLAYPLYDRLRTRA